ncbi:hypothetical protein N781_15470 [Pontibacillus halophilus JSM 076056 = DSM 19796]|uniref:Ornithine cyclodeaminase n=1 Tax=Pontibacillus halophilus JSM 076056 = DSM 19796 TaxID=1385510 RepID=A0A0A5GHQ3_9BACI|nr:NAD(P)-binding domain-containing protein [Pontibacillus halophilus]KGX92796.1 hypothetical protein N781_15470 [Pontibacillus halophilus JSM 076056 = DSM 19796]
MNVFSKDIREYINVVDVMNEIEAYHLEPQRESEIAPDRMHVEDGERTALLMPAFYEEYYSVKLAGVSPSNVDKGKPSVQATIMLYNRDTMEPLLSLDGNQITGLRTAAISGLGMKYIAPQDASVLGIVGTGLQGWTHLEAAMAVRNIHTVYLHSRNKEKVDAFKQQIHEHYPNVTVMTKEITELVERSDIIVTATSSSSPVLPDVDCSSWTSKHITAVGSFRPDMQEIPDGILQEIQNVYVDQPAALHESGDIIRASELRGVDQFPTLEEVIQSEDPPAYHENVSLFKCVGGSIYDLLATKALYKKL